MGWGKNMQYLFMSRRVQNGHFLNLRVSSEDYEWTGTTQCKIELRKSAVHKLPGLGAVEEDGASVRTWGEAAWLDSWLIRNLCQVPSRWGDMF